MDQLKGAFSSFSGGGNNQNPNQNQNQAIPQQGSEQSSSGGGGFFGGIGDKFNSAAGGGRESEKNEDYVDKGKLSMPLYCTQSNSHRRCRLRSRAFHGPRTAGQ